MTVLIQNLSLGQSTWIDFIQRSMLLSGEFEDLIAKGVTGLTSNPTIFQKAITTSSDYDSDLKHYSQLEKTPFEIFEALTVQDIQTAADILLPIYQKSNYKDGFVSLEVRPSLSHDTEGTVAEANRLWRLIDRPNAMIKVPATNEGIKALKILISQQININVTLIFSLNAYTNVMDSYIEGLLELNAAGKDISRVASVASFFVSRVDTAIDSQLAEQSELRGKAAIANAKVAYQKFEKTFLESDFQKLRTLGAQYQRPLWASTSTKNPQYPDTLYVDNLVGPYSVNTMPPETLNAVLDHGKSAITISDGTSDADKTLLELSESGISMEKATDRLLAEGITAFSKSFDEVILSIKERCEEFAAAK